jgi:hypothetical protein
MEMNWTTVPFVAAAMVMPYFPVTSTTGRAVSSSYRRMVPKDAVYLKDDSDWWSPASREGADLTAEEEDLFEDLRSKKPIPRDLGKFSILGVRLNSHEGDDWLREIEPGLGKTKIVERGDGAAGRSQLCYKSPAGSGNVKLIFEHNEIFYSYYLFDDGHEWKGVEYCAESSKVTTTLATSSGLKLGMTEAETESVLGGPTYARGNIRWYRFEGHRFATDLPDQPEDWVISGTLELRFSNSRLMYLAVSRSEVS